MKKFLVFKFVPECKLLFKMVLTSIKCFVCWNFQKIEFLIDLHWLYLHMLNFCKNALIKKVKTL